MTLCMFYNEGIFSNKFVDFNVVASRQSAFEISEYIDLVEVFALSQKLIFD